MAVQPGLCCKFFSNVSDSDQPGLSVQSEQSLGCVLNGNMTKEAENDCTCIKYQYFATTVIGAGG